jgi:two-component system, OmpR family, sensor histidine kinase KdpD
MTHAHPRGRLKIFLGYAAGVGKTWQMLDAAQHLRAEGVDVVIGYFEPHGRKDTIAKTEGLESVPRRRVEYRGSLFEEMDTDALVARNPRVCLVDEFPHSNVPGSPRTKRWEDVQLLLDAGIDILTTMNIQHLESLNDQVFDLTGIRVRETIPDWLMEQANEVVMVDLTPRALLNRLQRGVVYSREKAERALENFFRESTLGALRELALRQTAHEVDLRTAMPASSGRDRILVVVTAHPQTAMVIRRARRVSDFLGAECFAAATQPEDEEIMRHLNFARNLRIETRVLEGHDPAGALVDFARRNQITQIYVANSQLDLVRRIVPLAKDMQVVIVAAREPA